MDIKTKVGSVVLNSPLLIGSGYITEDTSFYARSVARGCAGMVSRSLKFSVPRERQRVPAPRYVVTKQGSMLNCEWGNEKPWTNWRDGEFRRAKEIGGVTVISLSGRDIESCKRLIAALNPLKPDAYEINVSCAHSGELHGNLNLNIGHLRLVLQSIRSLTNCPIWIKLSYSSILVDMAVVAEQNGADAIVCTNSIGPGLFLDPETGRPLLGIMGGAGGLTGEAIFPIALQCVYKLRKHLSIPIVGVGGIGTAEHVIQMMLAGASAVQLYTAPALHGPRVFEEIAEGLKSYLGNHRRFSSLEQLIGYSHTLQEKHVFTTPPPMVIEDACTGCVECASSCAFDALKFVNRGVGQPNLVVIKDNCIGCNACVGVCPPEFNALRITK